MLKLLAHLDEIDGLLLVENERHLSVRVEEIVRLLAVAVRAQYDGESAAVQGARRRGVKKTKKIKCNGDASDLFIHLFRFRCRFGVLFRL